MGAIRLVNLRKDYGKENVIPDLNLDIVDGSFTVLVGPSGCGKSTTLRMIAGLEKPTSGQILIDGVDVANMAPGKRDLAMVFQNYALYPTMSVRKNIEFGLINKKVPKEKRDSLIADVSEIVGLTPYLDRKPANLSGGQRQRVALARAMVKEPKVFLMDEPLSNLDAKLRASMRVELIELHKRLKTTFIYVTHDQTEAMSMGDVIVLMNKGIIMQQSSPKNMYHNPEKVSVGFRPEKVTFTEQGKAALVINGTIATKEQLGAEYNYSVSTPQGKIMVKTEDDCQPGACKLYVQPQHLFAFDAQGKRIEMSEAIIAKLSRG